MSCTAWRLRQDGHTWEYIADHLGFISPDAARWSALRYAEVTGNEPPPDRQPGDGDV